MSERDLNITVEITDEHLARFQSEARYILDLIDKGQCHTLLAWFDPIDQALKFKANNRTWSPPMGEVIA